MTMTPQGFCDWLAQMKAAGKAKSAAEAGRLLGLSSNVITRLKQQGADTRTSLACWALLAGIDPAKGVAPAEPERPPADGYYWGRPRSGSTVWNIVHILDGDLAAPYYESEDLAKWELSPRLDIEEPAR